MFKQYTAHNVQDVFWLWETTAVENGVSEAVWKRTEVNKLLKDFTFLSEDSQVTQSAIFSLPLTVTASLSTIWTRMQAI